MSSTEGMERVDALRRALSDAEAEYGVDSREAIQAQIALAGWYIRAGELAEARSITERALERSSRHKEPYVAVGVKAIFGRVLSELGEFEQAELLQREVIEYLVSTTGTDNRSVLDQQMKLARTLRFAGDFNALEVLYREMIDAAVRLDHTLTIALQRSLALTLRTLGRFDESLAISEAVVASLTSDASTTDQGLLEAKLAMVHDLMGVGRDEEGLRTLRNVVDDARAHLAANDPIRAKAEQLLVFVESIRPADDS